MPEPRSPFTAQYYLLLGPVGVALFFMITGFLFWTRLLKARFPVKWTSLYLNRIFRIGPLYCLVIVIYLVSTLHIADFPVAESPGDVAVQAARWLALGVYHEPEPFLGFKPTTAIVGQTWTLYYEWMFYLSLPVLAVLTKGKQTTPLVSATLFFEMFVFNFIPPGPRLFIAHFLIGMLAGSVLHEYPQIKGDGVVRSMVACAAMFFVFHFCDVAYSASTALLLGAFFLLVVSGTSLFGLLRLTGARRLGDISYSLYLMHGAVLTLLFSWRPLVELSLTRSAHYYVMQALCTAILLAICVGTYLLIEKPGIALGRIIGRSRESTHQLDAKAGASTRGL
jgi:peptidoglycan/LPS O-acetylase OafA/YrhL